MFPVDASPNSGVQAPWRPVPVGGRAPTEDPSALLEHRLRVIPLRDPVVEEIGFHPRSEYVEQFWLPVLGPSATWLIRRLADHLDAAGGPCEVNLDDLAPSLGLGHGSGRHAPIRRAVARCARFGVVRPMDAGILAVRRCLAPLPRRQLIRLPITVQDRHRAWDLRRRETPALDALRRRARLLALDLTELGEERQHIERHLCRWGIHPALAYEAVRWSFARLQGANAGIPPGA